MICPHCGRHSKNPRCVAAGGKGGAAGTGASKARTTKQARKAARAMWARRREMEEVSRE
jgi:hypothetical protein